MVRRRAAAIKPFTMPALNMSTGHAVTDRMFSSHAQAIESIQNSTGARLRVVSGIKLADTANVYVPHGLGRALSFVSVSVVRGALSVGMVRDVTDGSLPSLFNTPVDLARYVVLRADGYGATITVDLLVM